MGKIGDLFVRLGLKSDDFKRGIGEAKQDVNELGQTFQGMSGKAVGVWSAIGNFAANIFAEIIRNSIKMADAFIHHSQRLGDAWTNTMNGMKSAASALFTSVSNWDWNGIGDKMRGAFSAGKASSAAHDAEFEVENSIKLRKAKMAEEQAQLRIEMMNQQKSYAERIKAAEDYLAAIKPLYDEEIKLRQNIRYADLNEWLGQGGFAETADNRDLLEKLLTDIAPNETLMNALDQWTRRNQNKKFNLSPDDQRVVDEFFNQYGASVGGTLAAMANAYIGSGDKETKKVVDAIYGLYAAKAAFDEETRRIQNVKNTASAASSASIALQTDNGTDSGIETALARIEAAFASMNRKMRYEKEESARIEKEWLDDFTAFSEQLQPVLDEIQDGINGIDTEGFEDKVNSMQIVMEDMMHALEEGLIAAFNELANVIAGVEDADFASVTKALLTPLADMAIKAGTIIMLSGKAMQALNTALTSGGAAGVGAIIAGAGLVAIGVAAKAGLSAIGKGGSSSATTTTSATSSSYGSSGVTTAELTVYVKGSIKGSDIYLSGQNTLNEWNK